MEPTKACSKCNAAKPATTEFFVKKLGGLSSRCKPCLKIDKRAAWAANAEKNNAARRATRDDGTRERERAYYAANVERKRATDAARRKANPERRAANDRRQYLKNREKRIQQAAEWKARNADRAAHNLREWHRRQRATDPGYRLDAAISAYVYWCLKSDKGGRKTEELLGYSGPVLRSHLERQFLPGMTWQNYGQWHVDHVVPVASFSFENADDPEFKACWALTNLRPMWAADNIRKSDKRTLLL